MNENRNDNTKMYYNGYIDTMIDPSVHCVYIVGKVISNLRSIEGQSVARLTYRLKNGMVELPHIDTQGDSAWCCMTHFSETRMVQSS